MESLTSSATDGGAWREFLRDGVGRDRQLTAARGWSPSRLRSAADGGAWRTGGFLSRSMEHIWREEKSGSRGGSGDARNRAFAKPDNYVKFALSFAKLLKIQTPNAKPLDTSFYDFWQITRMQIPNAKPFEMLLVHPKNQKLILRHIKS